MLEIELSERAERELDEVLDYIALADPIAAARLFRKVSAAIERAARFPRSGRRIPEVPEETARELVVPPSRIFYEADAERVLVLAIRRSQRRFDPGILP